MSTTTASWTARTPQPHPSVLQIIPYTPGESKLEGHARVILLASNESPFGASPHAIEAARAALEKTGRYPDNAAKELRVAIGSAHDIDPDLIVASNGSEQLISLVARAFTRPGDDIVQTQYGFLAYRIAALAAGARVVAAPEVEYRADVAALVRAVTPSTRVVYLANPNNPTGTYLTRAELEELRARLPPDVLLVVDAAYAEYVCASDYSAGDALVYAAVSSGANNVIMLRTFSKLHGLAALRVGWGYGPATVVDALHRVRETFNVSAVAQEAAIAALADRTHANCAREHNTRWVQKLSRTLALLGLRVTPSIGNFILVLFDGAGQATAADRHLRSEGIIVRPVAGYGLGHALRITVGSDADNEALLRAMARYLGRSVVPSS